MPRRPRSKPGSKPRSTAPNDGSPLGSLSDAELIQELARRRAAAGKLDLSSMELATEETKREVGAEALAAMVAGLPPEDDRPKVCPKCRRPVPIKSRHRERTVLTLSGDVTFSRHYHHCEQCRLGFYPRDAELALPEEGDVSGEMKKRIADFGVNHTFDSAAERWTVHYPSPISENLVRRVVESLGKRCEGAGLLEGQLAAKPRTARRTPPRERATRRRRDAVGPARVRAGEARTAGRAGRGPLP